MAITYFQQISTHFKISKHISGYFSIFRTAVISILLLFTNSAEILVSQNNPCKFRHFLWVGMEIPQKEGVQATQISKSERDNPITCHSGLHTHSVIHRNYVCLKGLNRKRVTNYFILFGFCF